MLSVSSVSSEQSIPLLQIDPQNNPARLKNRSIYIETVGNIGCFPGWKKKRLDLSPFDTTHRFGIALLEKSDVSEAQLNNTWVYVQSSVGPVEAKVSSIAKRLRFKDNAEVMELARSEGINPANTALEERIQKIIDVYEQDFKTLKAFFSGIRDSCLDARKIEELILDSNLEKEINDPNIAILCKKFLDDCRMGLVLSDSALEFNRMLKEFKLRLAELDGNFASFVRKNVVEDTILWGQSTPNLLVDAKARKTGADSTGEAAVRLKIYPRSDPYNRYAIKTDGYIYYDKPVMTGGYVPYSGDGKTWVLLKIKSLHYRTGIPVEDIKAGAGADGNEESGLHVLLGNTISSINRGSLSAARVHPDGPTLIPEGYDLTDIFCQITKYLPIESLKSLEMVNSEYKADIDCAILGEAKSQGYWGSDIDEANQFLKDYHAGMCKEISKFREIRRYCGTLFDFDRDLPHAFFNFNGFTEDKLLSICRTILEWGPAIPKLSKRFFQERGNEVMRMAVKRKNWKVLDDLLKYGIKKDNFDADGNSLLHLALICIKNNDDQYSFLNLLLKSGCDINVQDRQGNTPLHLAILNSASDCVELLLKFTPRMNIKNEQGESALDLLKRDDVGGDLLLDATRQKNAGTIKWLLQNGVDVNAVDVARNTALHLAALYGEYLIMQLILQNSQPKIDLRNALGDKVQDIINRQMKGKNGKFVPYFVREALGIEIPYDIMNASMDQLVYFPEDEVEVETGA